MRFSDEYCLDFSDDEDNKQRSTESDQVFDRHKRDTSSKDPFSTDRKDRMDDMDESEIDLDGDERISDPNTLLKLRQQPVLFSPVSRSSKDFTPSQSQHSLLNNSQVFSKGDMKIKLQRKYTDVPGRVSHDDAKQDDFIRLKSQISFTEDYDVNDQLRSSASSSKLFQSEATYSSFADSQKRDLRTSHQKI